MTDITFLLKNTSSTRKVTRIDKIIIKGKRVCEWISLENLYVDIGVGKLLTYPSPKPTLTLTSHFGQNAGSGGGVGGQKCKNNNK